MSKLMALLLLCGLVIFSAFAQDNAEIKEEDINYIFPISNVFNYVWEGSAETGKWVADTKHPLRPQCLRHSADKLYASFSNYENFHNIDNNHEFILPVIGTKQVEMVASSSRPALPRPGISPDPGFSAQDERHDLVALTFRPILTDDPAFYPQWSLECALGKKGKEFYQNCFYKYRERKEVTLVDGQVVRPRHFAMVSFKSRIKVVEGAAQCAGDSRGGTLLQYSVFLGTYKKEIDQLKDHMVGTGTFSRGLVDFMFNENDFFRGYYQELFKVWMKEL